MEDLHALYVEGCELLSKAGIPLNEDEGPDDYDGPYAQHDTLYWDNQWMMLCNMPGDFPPYEDTVRDLIGAHFERLWCGLPRHSISLDGDRGAWCALAWEDDEMFVSGMDADKLTAIVMALKKKYGNE